MSSEAILQIIFAIIILNYLVDLLSGLKIIIVLIIKFLITLMIFIIKKNMINLKNIKKKILSLT